MAIEAGAYLEMMIALKQWIEPNYAREGYRLGWRLLYSPANTLLGANVAFIGLNPGGAGPTEGHAEFSTQSGSAYVTESWGAAPGESPLQKQVRSLFRMLGEPPEKVLAGNLVPFRSPSWSELPNRQLAMQLGKSIWSKVLSKARPSLVITMGSETANAVADILSVNHRMRVPIDWGNMTAWSGDYDGGRMVALPHLSRYQIMNRPRSRPALQTLFGLR